MNKIIIVVEDGQIVDVKTNSKEHINVCILDFDVQDEAFPIKTYEGEETECHVFMDVLEKDEAFVEHYFKEIEKE